MLLDRGQAVAYMDDGASFDERLLEDLLGHFFEAQVAYATEELIHQEDVGIRLHCDSEFQPREHARGEELHLGMYIILELCHRDDAVMPLADLFHRKAEDGGIEEDILVGSEIWIEAHAECHAHEATVHVDLATGIGRIGACHDVQERGLPGSVVTDDAEKLALVDLETDVVESPDVAFMLLREDIEDAFPDAACAFTDVIGL